MASWSLGVHSYSSLGVRCCLLPHAPFQSYEVTLMNHLFSACHPQQCLWWASGRESFLTLVSSCTACSATLSPKIITTDQQQVISLSFEDSQEHLSGSGRQDTNESDLWDQRVNLTKPANISYFRVAFHTKIKRKCIFYKRITVLGPLRLLSISLLLHYYSLLYF